jgi:hypothetical protein
MLRSSLALFSVFVLSFMSLTAVTLEEVIQNNLEARGGLEKIKALQTAKFGGTMQTMGGEINFTQIYKGNSKMRLEMNGEGFTMTQATDGIIAWGDSPFGGGGPQVLTGPAADNLHRQADLAGDFVDHEKKGLKLELKGSEDVDGLTAYVINVTDPEGETVQVYVDAITWLEVKIVRAGEMMGREMTFEVNLSNYQDIGGVVVPMQIDINSNGRELVSMTRTSFEVNIPVDDTVFSLPAKN